MELKEIALQLAEHSAQMEQQTLDAHRDALEKLAATKNKEEARRVEERKVQEEANERAEKSRADKQSAIETQLREEAEARKVIEQEADRKKTEVEKDLRIKEEIAKQVAEVEHAADKAARQLEDAKNRIVVTETIPEHPLKRFLQATPE